MQKIFFLCIIISNYYDSYSQNNKVKVSFQISRNIIRDSCEANLSVTYYNPTNDSIYIYNTLREGSLYSSMSNIHIEGERLVKGRYKKDFYKSDGQELFLPDLSDSILIKIAPKKGSTTVINLLENFSGIRKGKYRIKVYLLKIPNNINKPTEMSYIESKYIYFEVVRNLVIKPLQL
jgi:hypothetical protein